MFESFYRLSANPFRLTPDPKFCFRHPSYNQAYAYLQYALRLGEGFIMVTGRPGIGKTTLAEVFLTEIQHSEVVAARVASANVETADLLRVVAYAYGIDVAGLDKATVMLDLEQFFVRQTRRGRRVLLIVDEAQSLPHAALEELRLLADLQMDSRPLVQLFLVGQEKLREVMREPDMEQFQQRVIGACHLQPLDLKGTKSYVEHRLRKAGWKGDPALTGAAVAAIFHYSRGVPRHVNKICTRVLLQGMLEEKHELHKDDVLAVAAELRAEQLAPMEADEGRRRVDEEDPELLAELETDAVSISQLAIRMDAQEAEQLRAEELAAVPPKRQATGATRETLGREDSRQLPDDGEHGRPNQVSRAGPQRRRARSVRPDVRHSPDRQQRSSAAGESVEQPFRRQQAGTAATVSGSTRRGSVTPWKVPSRESRPMRRLSRLARRLSEKAAEALRWLGRLSWRAKLAVLVVALLAVNLITAALTTDFFDASDEHKSLLVGYPQRERGGDGYWQPRGGSQASSADGVRELSQDGGATPHSTAREDIGSDDAAGAAAKPASGGDDWVANIAGSWDRDGLIVSPDRRAPAPHVSESVVKSASSQQTAVAALAGTDQVAAGARVAPTVLKEPIEAQRYSERSMQTSMSQPGSERALHSSASVEDEETAEQQLDNDSLTVAKAAEAEISLQLPAASAPGVAEDASTQAASRQQSIARLLALADQALKRDRLLIPSNDSAFKYFQETLILDPGNREALFGLERVAARYIVLAKQAVGRQDKKKANLYVQRGLRISPRNRSLLELKDELNAPVVRAEPVPQPPVIPVEERRPVAELEPEPKDFISRLKAFFSKGQAADQRREVIVEERQ